MHVITDEEFSELISRAMDELPERDIKNLNNVVVTYDDEPSLEQRRRLKLTPNQTLFGLYEGIPLTKRGANYNLVLPDKITLFKFPILSVAHSPEALFEQIKHTLWHEIAHFYGLNHTEIHQKEG